jgi:Uma2 family endonuclease
MAMATMVPRYTAAEVREFDHPRLRFEVIRGELFVSPSGPGQRHQEAVGELFYLLRGYLERERLGRVFVAPFEVEFTEDSATQPDVLVILNGRMDRLGEALVQGAPSLAIEVISYSSKRTDRLQKRELYLDEGVEDYWIVDCDQRRVERWRPGAEAPEVLTERLLWVPHSHAPPLEIDLEALFAKVWR